MANQENDPVLISWPGIVTLLVAMTGLVYSRLPLQSERPAPVAASGMAGSGGDSIPARLWQDPLVSMPRSASAKARRPCQVVDIKLPEDAPSVLFLFDCIDPDKDVEATETRRRERYAVLSGLSTAGFVPKQADRIAYTSFKFKSDPKLLIPFEWFLLPRGEKQTNKKQIQAVCVLWVSLQSGMQHRLQFLKQMRDDLSKAWQGKYPKAHYPHAVCRFAINGRIDSDQLEAMLGENLSTKKDDEPIVLYVTNSTSPSVRVIKRPANLGLQIEYVIDTDQRLVDALIKELQLRRLEVLDGERCPIAVVAEWDTTYGREMHRLFMQHKDVGGIHCYSYLRGLDGKAPGRAPEELPDKKNDDASAGATHAEVSTKPTTSPPTSEGEGDPQIDYLRRLARQMKADKDFKAIAVVGSDLYDKLLVLRALRAQFPSAVFLTTDLDVRLLQPAEYDTTRNLLIASHYGLSLRKDQYLHKDLQRAVAPFRSSYDTASYLGVLWAVGFDALKPLVYLAEPEERAWNGSLLVPTGKLNRMPVHVYETGRSGAYELTLRQDDQLGPPNPRLTPWIAQPYRLCLALVIAILVALLLYPVSRTWQGFVHWLLRRKPECPPAEKKNLEDHAKKIQYYRAALLAGFLGVMLASVIYLAHTSEEGEPFELFEGISTWPTVILRALALSLCILYLCKGWQQLVRRNEKLDADYDLDVYKKCSLIKGTPLELAWQAWTAEPEETEEVRKLALKYAAWGQLKPRAWRTGIMAFVNVVLFFLLWFLFFPTVLQARGWVAQWSYVVVALLTVVALAVLLMFVVDSTLLSFRFVTSLYRLEQPTWPPQLLARTAQRWGLVSWETGGQGESALRRARDAWLLIHLIDDVSHVVARLIYYPFIVLLVLVVAQNPLFDDWHWNMVLVFMVIFNVGVAVASGVLLHRAALRAKRKALDSLDQLLRERTGSYDPVREKLTQMQTDIQGTTSGAFAGFYQNPIVRAVLLPLAGGGGLAALEALLQYTH